MYKTAETVSPGHPDKIADLISDYVLTEALSNNSKSRVGVETFLTGTTYGGLVVVGGEISDTFFKYEAIPPMVARMLRVGEETGRISSILEDIARFYRSEVDQITKNISSLVEPILIVILGIGVGVLVISVLLPIYNIAGQI